MNKPIKEKYDPETIVTMKAATLGIIKYIEREHLTEHPAPSVYTTLADYMRATYPQFNSEQIDDCVYYAMQACLF